MLVYVLGQAGGSSSRPDVVPSHGRGSIETGLAGARGEHSSSYGSNNHLDNSTPSRSLSSGLYTGTALGLWGLDPRKLRL